MLSKDTPYFIPARLLLVELRKKLRGHILKFCVGFVTFRNGFKPLRNSVV